MRQMDIEEVLEMLRRRSGASGGMGKLEGEKWFTFEHDMGWRQTHTQFLGAVRSHGECQPEIIGRRDDAHKLTQV